MSTTRRALVLCCSLFGIFLAWFLPTMILAVHDAWGMSIAAEFQAHNLINTEQLEKLRETENAPGYSIEGRIRNSDTFRHYLTLFSVLTSAPFLAIIFLTTGRSQPEKSESTNTAT